MNDASVLSPKNLKEWLTFSDLDAPEARRMALALLDGRETLRADRDRLASDLDHARAKAANARADAEAILADRDRLASLLARAVPFLEQVPHCDRTGKYHLNCDHTLADLLAEMPRDGDK